MHEIFLFTTLAAGAFFAGLVDSIVGGGGLIQQPILMSALANEKIAVLFGTNKIASVFGTANAAFRFARKIKMPWRVILPASIAAFIFSYFGAQMVSQLPIHLVRPAVLFLLIFAAIYTFKKKQFGNTHEPLLSGKLEMMVALAIGAAIGFYDGFFGPGTGSFLIFLFIRFFGFDFLHASASAKVVNVVTNLAAISFFVPNGFFIPLIALFMAAANMSGSFVGTHLALKHGSGFVRKIFLFVVVALICKIAWDTFKLDFSTAI